MSKEKDTIKALVNKLQDISKSKPVHLENIKKIAEQAVKIGQKVKGEKER